ncbi:hypothetical protein JCM10213v2_009110 [Rhodosporidiobolus nylandii]
MGAQENFASLCGDVTFSQYCSAPWHFFNLLIVLFQPHKAAWYIAAQLMAGNMFVVAVMARDIMGTLSDGVNGLQRWQAEFAFLMASASASVIIACVFSDTHHIHGFLSRDAFDTYLKDDHTYQLSLRAAESPAERKKTYGPHSLHKQAEDKYVRGEHVANATSALDRLRKWAHRHQALLLLLTFSLNELYWFIMYAATVWWGDTTIFWQSYCDDFIGSTNYRLIEGISFTFSSLAFLATLFLCIPVFSHKVGTSQSAAHFVVRLFSLHGQHPRQSIKQAKDKYRQRKAGSGAPLEPAPEQTRPELLVKVTFSFAIWGLWFVTVLVVLIKALENFLLVGLPWP